MLLLGWGRGAGPATFDLSKPGNHTGIDAIGLLQQSHAFGKATDGPRIENGHGKTASPQLQESWFFVSTRGLHGHQLDSLLAAKLGQFSDALMTVGETMFRTLTTDAGVQITRRNIHSTNDLGHGNLPCTCDWKSGDCSVVRANDGEPHANPRWSPPQGQRASPPCGGSENSGPSPQHSLNSCRCYTDTREQGPRTLCSWPLSP